MKILIASNNLHKIEEVREILKPLGISLITPSEIGGIPEVEETGTTFEENAKLKALKIAKLLNISTFADDSGLEVEALNNRPGVFSARYAGPNATDTDKINKLLTELINIKNRRARFVCVIAIASPLDDIKMFKGVINGKIAEHPTGNNGFGYDPIFIPDGFELSFAELDSSIKNKISHRAVALKLASNELAKLS